MYTDHHIHRKGMDWVVYFEGQQSFSTISTKCYEGAEKPEIKKVLRTVGEEAVNTGGEVLIDSLRGNGIEKMIDTRINTAKKTYC